MSTDEPVLEMPAELFRTARGHAAESYPAECCGILVGRIEGSRHVVVRVQPAENAREEQSRHNRYLIPPSLVASTLREAARAGLDVVGYYHSHPDHPSRPSEFDRDHAWPNTSYLIYSVLEGRPDRAQSWRLRDDRSAFDEERIESSDEARDNAADERDKETP